MNLDSGEQLSDDSLVFAREDESVQDEIISDQKDDLWKILIVDDEDHIHQITQLTLRGYTFRKKGIKLLSAYSRQDVESILNREPDIALIFLDVVMEEDDTGLALVDYIRNTLKNSTVRIVLRTGQPGKAPEHEVIVRYDINDYKTKPEFTAQKLFTTVTSCLRAYDSLKQIQDNVHGLEKVIDSTAQVFEKKSFSMFGERVISQLLTILNLNGESGVESVYLVGMPGSPPAVLAGTGTYSNMAGASFEQAMSDRVKQKINEFQNKGGESFGYGEYLGVFKTSEDFSSVLYLKHGGRLTGLQKKLVRIFANNIAIGFDNISLAREIINTQKEVILTLGEIVETRSQETAHHVTRVAEFCYLLAQKCGMDEKTCEMVRLASPMHDVGKIGVPEAILNKPGKLTDVEFEIIQEHARTGYEILKKSNRPIMQTAAIIAYQHHERWDGKGYPNGLVGENIHMFGRIAAIADVFDALTHRRCYKLAWPMEKVITLFKNEAGYHFDKKLVDIFLTNIQEFENINKRFPE